MSEPREPHFVDDYRRYVNDLSQKFEHDDAMSFAVGGGDFTGAGEHQLQLLRHFGFGAGDRIVDVGCGSGRLAAVLSREYGAGIGYLGLDVVPELLEHAAQISDPSYSFATTTGLSLPIDDGECDVVVFFSVITHLRHEESYRYLRDAARAVRPGGLILASFLESERHWSIFERVVDIYGNPDVDEPAVVFVERPMLETWASKLGVEIEQIVAFDAPGQSVAVLRRPEAPRHP
jgi:SAM-dependent methyltransferase